MPGNARNRENYGFLQLKCEGKNHPGVIYKLNNPNFE
jgi:hypothetical protein